MKKNNLLLILVFLCFSYVVKSIDASISFATFKSPEQNYIEIYLHVSGKSVAFVPVDTMGLQASVEVVILFKRGENIEKFDKYLLFSPFSDGSVDFIDLKRYALMRSVDSTMCPHIPSACLHKDTVLMKRLTLSIAFLVGAVTLAGC